MKKKLRQCLKCKLVTYDEFCYPCSDYPSRIVKTEEIK